MKTSSRLYTFPKSFLPFTEVRGEGEKENQRRRVLCTGEDSSAEDKQKTSGAGLIDCTVKPTRVGKQHAETWNEGEGTGAKLAFVPGTAKSLLMTKQPRHHPTPA